MERYTVNYSSANGPPMSLLVPLSPASTVKNLAEEIQRRLSKRGILANANELQFRLGKLNGPQLDDDDALKDVVLDSQVEQLFASPETNATNATTGSGSGGNGNGAALNADNGYPVC